MSRCLGWQQNDILLYADLFFFYLTDELLQPFAGIIRLPGVCEALLAILFKRVGDDICGLILHRVDVVPQHDRILDS